MKRIASIAVTVFAVFVLLGAPSGVSAAGYENIGGQNGYHIYTSERYIDNPATAGPEVAFKRYTSEPLLLGAHSCSGTLWGLHSMAYATWSTVYTTSSSKWFCLYGSSTYNWNGDLAWD